MSGFINLPPNPARALFYPAAEKDRMHELAAVKLEVKKSRFYAHLYAIDSPDDLSAILALHRERYRKAAHHCTAVRFVSASETAELSRNDGEVGHPGRALLQVLEKYSLDRHALIVSRIFGGIKLGPGGVTRAFRDAGEGAAAWFRDGAPGR